MPGSSVEGPAVLLRVLRESGPSTRQELISSTGLTRAQVDQRLDTLRGLGLVLEEVVPNNTGGRRARAVALQSQAGFVLTFCVGVTGLVVAAVDLDGNLIDERRSTIDVTSGPHDVLGRCIELGEELPAASEAQPWGIGVCVPGPVDIDKGIVVSPPLMPGWDHFPIRDWVADKLQSACWLDNDANAACLGEFRRGAGRTLRERSSGEMVYVHLGSGIGAGIVMGGALRRGDGGCAGDMGHLPSPGAQVPCPCGNIGCLEAVAGGRALGPLAEQLAADGTSPALEELKRQQPDMPLTAASLAHAAQHGDPSSIEELRTAGTRIGEVLASVVSLLNPSQLVLGGGLTQSGDILLSSVRKSLYARALPLASRDLLVRRAALGDLGAVFGMAEEVLEGLFAVETLDQWLPQGTPQGLPALSRGRRPE